MKRVFIFLLFLFLSNSFSFGQTKEYNLSHFFYGMPGCQGELNDLISRDIYVLCNDGQTKFADWVAYRLDSSSITGETKARNWKADPDLPENRTLEPDDYKDANKTLKVDRGHQAPLASFKGRENWAATNYLSNITPQKSDLNQGTWVKIENAVRDIIKDGNTVYVITGTLYEKEMPKLPKSDEEHLIPSGYWKIIFIPKANDEFEHASFILDQDTERSREQLDFLVTIDEIENRTNLDFLNLLDDEKEVKIEADKNESWAEKYFK